MSGISMMGRNTQGVRLINIREDDEVGTLARVQKNEEQSENEEDGDWEETEVTDNRRIKCWDGVYKAIPFNLQ